MQVFRRKTSHLSPLTFYSPNFSVNINKPSFLNVVQESENPFYNPQAASVNSQILRLKEQIKLWQAEFKEKNNRRPTMEEMKNDSNIGEVFKEIDDLKKELKSKILKKK